MPVKMVPTVCCFCGCGCALYLRVENGCVTGSAPSRNHPVSKGNLCVKGWHIHEFVHHPARLKRPMVRQNGELVETTWEHALDAAAEGIRNVLERYGSQTIGALSSAKCTNEENFLLQKFVRAVLGTNSIDHCARL